MDNADFVHRILFISLEPWHNKLLSCPESYHHRPTTSIGWWVAPFVIPKSLSALGATVFPPCFRRRRGGRRGRRSGNSILLALWLQSLTLRLLSSSRLPSHRSQRHAEGSVRVSSGLLSASGVAPISSLHCELLSARSIRRDPMVARSRP